MFTKRFKFLGHSTNRHFDTFFSSCAHNYNFDSLLINPKMEEMNVLTSFPGHRRPTGPFCTSSLCYRLQNAVLHLLCSSLFFSDQGHPIQLTLHLLENLLLSLLSLYMQCLLYSGQKSRAHYAGGMAL